MVETAAAEKEGRADLHVSMLITGGQSLVYDSPGYRDVVSVPLKTLDSILAECGVERVDLVKIDVEGAAPRVLDGAPRLLASKPRLVMEVEGGESNVAAMSDRLRGLGYGVRAVENILYASPSA